MPEEPPTAARTSQPILPFLVLAYPLTSLLYRGGQYCGPVCFEPTPVGFVAVAGTLIVVGVIAAAVALGLRTLIGGPRSRAVRPLVSPSRRASIVLLALFGAFVLFLTLDAVTIYEAVWKPVVLPVSFVLFLPVWLLYGLTFPVAVLFSIVGVEPSPLITDLVRGVVLSVGFPLSAVMQTYVVSATANRWETKDQKPIEPT